MPRPRLWLLALLAFLLAPRPAHAAVPDEASVRVAAGVSDFGIDLYAQLRGQPGNLVFSPASIGFALGMVDGGAGGTTARELEHALHLDGDAAALLQQGFAGLLGGGRAMKGVKLRIANRLWAQKGFAFAKNYLALTRSSYGAEVALADFARNAEAERKAINAWVKKTTNGRIVELLPPHSVSDLTSLVIVNAIWFKGEWAHKFDKRATHDAGFTLLSGSPVDVSMMQMEAPARLAMTDGVRVLELDYAGGEMSMVLILPDDGKGFARLEERLTAAHLGAWLGALKDLPKVDIQLPRFKAEQSLALSAVLAQLGVRQLFSDDADLSRMLASGEKQLKVTGAFHKAFVAVDEQGAEAAAATGMVVGIESVEMPPPEFHADRPFVWLIRDRQRGLVYFLGRVIDPR